jgi:CHASE2 domain-containing sensor protein
VKFNAVMQHKWFDPAVGAGLAVLCGLGLWELPLGERWINASYDYLFRFGSRTATNQLALVLMDNEAYRNYTNEVRGQPWSRARHAELLNKLADDGCALVVFDAFFRGPREQESDRALAAAIRRQRGIVLMAEHAAVNHPELASAGPTLPAEMFLTAARSNWGVAWLDPDLDSIVRRHWPFPSPAFYPSLPWTAARLVGAKLRDSPEERWLRYYGRYGSWESLSYHVALGKGPKYFQNKFVFIGSKPESSAPSGEKDEFATPYSRWAGETSGGTEIQAAVFLNLMNGEWLRRLPAWLEILVLAASGIVLGGMIGRVRPLPASALAVGAALAVTIGAVLLSHASNFWFPWLVIAGGQVPCALAFALVLAAPTIRFGTKVIPQGADDGLPLPDTPDYELVVPHFAQGAYGKVWLARNAVGQWQALKAIYLAKFKQSAEPYEREMKGVERYKPFSDKHPGLVRVDFVSRKKPQGYFYYVMELGDAQAPGWEKNPASYKPRDLASVRAQTERGRLPVGECVRIGIALADALAFLHQQGLTHRDIKPSNIVFVNGHPKLADVGLVAEVRPPGQEPTAVGTPGYMPPPPEPPGTPQADIYGLGMVLYVVSTGGDPIYFPDLPTSLIEATGQENFLRLNPVILKACNPNRAQRYASAGEMRTALLEVQKALERAG